MKGKTKTQKGITLIALIITIVVLLILAVVAINSITNENILGYAANAATDYNKAVENEQGMLQEYEDYLTGINGGFEEYKVGDEVTIGTESFFVIKDSAKTESKLLLLAKYNLDTSDPTNLVQSSSAGAVAFSSTNYWKDEPSTAYPLDLKDYTIHNGVTSIITTAKAYGAKLGGAGRLITYDEAEALSTDTTFRTNFLGGPNFWFGYAGSVSTVGCVTGSNASYEESSGGYVAANDFYMDICGVRPVIEISKSKISQ